MKAFLLAAGLGTRLKPVTDSIPKCLVDICGRPLLSWWIELLEQHSITDVLINLHHHHNRVKEFISSVDSKIQIHLSHENTLLGSAGTIRENAWFINEETEFLVLYADNLTNCDLTAMQSFHSASRHNFTMALFHSEKPENCGIAQLNENAEITGFIEKPAIPSGNLANAGIYIASPEILNYIPDSGTADFGHNVLPALTGKMNGWICGGYLRDIGTPENLTKARDEWLHIIEKEN